MDMNEFEDAGETVSMGSPDEATGVGGNEIELHEEIRRLRIQLERLEASQGGNAVRFPWSFVLRVLNGASQ